MTRAFLIITGTLLTGAGLSVYEARGTETVDPVAPVLTVESFEPVFLTSSNALELTHWSCHESFGEQGRQGIVVGCVNGAAQYEKLPLVDSHGE